MGGTLRGSFWRGLVEQHAETGGGPGWKCLSGGQAREQLPHGQIRFLRAGAMGRFYRVWVRGSRGTGR